MNRLKTVVGLVTAVTGLALLSACATTDTAPNGQSDRKLAKEERETLTGSRIPAKSLPRNVKQVSGREIHRERPPDPGPLFQ